MIRVALQVESITWSQYRQDNYVKVCTYTHYACMHGCKIHSNVVVHL